jgi:hypothetical protein
MRIFKTNHIVPSAQWIASSGSTLVEQLTPDPKFEGSNPVAPGTVRVNSY